MSKEILAILTNKEVIALNQDPLGIQGRCSSSSSLSLSLSSIIQLISTFYCLIIQILTFSEFLFGNLLIRFIF
jgi:hypothetical protein